MFFVLSRNSFTVDLQRGKGPQWETKQLLSRMRINVDGHAHALTRSTRWKATPYFPVLFFFLFVSTSRMNYTSVCVRVCIHALTLFCSLPRDALLLFFLFFFSSSVFLFVFFFCSSCKMRFHVKFIGVLFNIHLFSKKKRHFFFSQPKKKKLRDCNTFLFSFLPLYILFLVFFSFLSFVSLLCVLLT